MSKIQVSPRKNFTIMSNCHFRERGLSLKAMGLFSLILSLPKDWDYTVVGLTKISKDGKDSISAAIKELKEFGYLELKRTRDSKGGFSSYDYIAHEEPIKCESPNKENPHQENPHQENPHQENPHQENPHQENPPQYNTNTSTSTKIINTFELNNNTPPSAASAQARCSVSKNTKTKTSAVEKPADVDQQAWDDWLVVRRPNKVTATALNGVIREATKAGYTLNEAITTCAERCWIGFKADWVKEKRAFKTKQEITHENNMQAEREMAQEIDSWGKTMLDGQCEEVEKR